MHGPTSIFLDPCGARSCKVWVLDVAGVCCREWLKKKNVNFFIGYRPVFGSSWDNEKLARGQLYGALPELHAHPAPDWHEELVFLRMGVPNELPLKFHEADYLPVEFAHNGWTPMLVDLAEFFCKHDFLHARPSVHRSFI
jgi:hypothetical protein